jgi:hypothetical protein
MIPDPFIHGSCSATILNSPNWLVACRGFNTEIDAETGAIEAELKTKWEEILNQEILSWNSTVVA